MYASLTFLNVDFYTSPRLCQFLFFDVKGFPYLNVFPFIRKQTSPDCNYCNTHLLIINLRLFPTLPFSIFTWTFVIWTFDKQSLLSRDLLLQSQQENEFIWVKPVNILNSCYENVTFIVFYVKNLNEYFVINS